MEDFITGIIAWLLIITIITIAYRLIKYKSLSEFPFGKVILWSLIIPCIALVRETISYLTRPSQQQIQQIQQAYDQEYDQELEIISNLTTKNIFMNNTSTYNEKEIKKIKSSTIYDNDFKLYWRAYFIYFLEDLDSSLITKTKHLGQRRNEVESKMLGKFVTLNDLEILNKIQNSFVYEHKVIIQNKIYTDKEYIDMLISWQLYKNEEKNYGLKIFKE
jgi:hypothetical protein